MEERIDARRGGVVGEEVRPTLDRVALIPVDANRRRVDSSRGQDHGQGTSRLDRSLCLRLRKL